jgi:hypothetical protein
MPVLLQKPVKNGYGEQFPLGQEDAFYEKVLFRVIIPPVMGVIGDRGIVKEPEVVNIPQDGTGGNFRLFCQGRGVGIGPRADKPVDKEQAVGSDFFLKKRFRHSPSFIIHTEKGIIPSMTLNVLSKEKIKKFQKHE